MAPVSRSTTRYGGIDLARLLLAVFVVLAHCAAFQAISPEAHFFANNGFARIIVPFFLMTTGYFYDSQMKRGLGPWLWRVGRVYLAWTLIFLPFILFYQERTVFRLVMTLGFGFFHLWYLAALLGGMVVLYWARDLRNQTLLILAAGLFLIGGAIQYAENEWLDFGAFRNHYDLLVLTRNFLFYGFPYLALGLLIRRTAFLQSLSAPARVLLMLGALFLLVAETWAEMISFPPDGFYDLTVSAFVLTPVLFVLVRDMPLEIPGFDPRRLSMIIYLSHPLYLIPLREFVTPDPVPLSLMTMTLTLAAVPIWLWLARRVPILP